MIDRISVQTDSKISMFSEHYAYVFNKKKRKKKKEKKKTNI